MIENTPEKWVSLAVHNDLEVDKNLGMIAVSDGYAYGCDFHRFHRCKTNISKNGMYYKGDITPVNITDYHKETSHLSVGYYPTNQVDKWLMRLNDIDSMLITKDDLTIKTFESGFCCYCTNDLFDRELYYNANFVDEAFNEFEEVKVNIVNVNNASVIIGEHDFGYFGIQRLKIL